MPPQVNKAFAGSGCILRLSNGDALTAGVRAFRSMGSGNSALKILWKERGTAGNGKTCSVVVSGNNTPLSVTVTTTDVTINSATNGSAAATSTVLDILTALYANQTFRDNWMARPGDGVTDPSGVIAAATSSALAGGAAGETFTNIVQVKGLTGPNLQAAVIDTTNFDSVNQVREFISGLKDPGQLTFQTNMIPNAWQAGQQKLWPLVTSGDVRTYEVALADYFLTTMSMSGIATGIGASTQLEQAGMLDVSIKVTGPVTFY
jgi:hypothetical protein